MSISDSSQRECALSLDISCVIRAPAGSGKTELLIQRVLVAMASVQSASQCLILTFTQKAVSELRERLSRVFLCDRQSLLSKTQELKEKVLNHARSQRWSMTTFWQQVNIQTLDAYFSKLDREFSSDDSQTDFKITLSPALQTEKIVDAFLEEYLIKNPDDDFLEICQHYDNSFALLKKLLQEIFMTREQWVTTFFTFEEQPQNLQSLFKEQRQVFKDYLIAHRSLFSELICWLGSYVDNFPEIDLDNEEQWLDSLPLWNVLAQTFITQKGQWRQRFTAKQGFPPPKELHAWHSREDKEHIIDSVKQIQNLWDESDSGPIRIFLSMLLIWPECQQVNKLEKLWRHVLKKLLAFAQVYKNNHQLRDFTDRTLSCWLLCQEQESWGWLSSVLDKEISHFFIDECQDLSYIQFSILKKILSICSFDPTKSFFAVGDPQQAIYHFRGSEVGVFQALEQLKIPGVDVKHLCLSTNFRSQKTLVSFFNSLRYRLFSSVSWPFLGLDKPLTAHAADSSKIHSSTVQAFSFSNAWQEARKIALDIKKSVKQFPDITIGVLARDRKSLRPIMQELEALNVPFNTSGIFFLLDKEIFFDIFALCRVLLEPEQKSFWPPVLRGLFLGASFNDIALFCSAQRESFFDALPSNLGFTSSFEQKFVQLFEHYQEYQPYLWRERVDRWLERFFYGYKIADYLDWQEKIFFKKILSCFSDVITPQELSLSLIEKQLRNVILRHSSQERISLLTIHQAKGLEYDRVYLPNLSASLPNQKPQLLYSIKTHKEHIWSLYPGTFDNQNQVYTFCQSIAAHHQRHESNRLLYVALTRARSQLILSHNQEYEYGHNFQKLLNEAIDFIPEKDLHQADKEENRLETMTILPSEHQRKFVNWQGFSFNQDPLEPLSIAKSQRLMQIVGLSWHRLLQLTKTWPIERSWLQKSSVEKLFSFYGAIEQEHNELFRRFAQIYNVLQKSSHAPKIFSSENISHESEYSISLLLKGRLVKRIVDKLIVDKDSQHKVYEIKSAAFSDISKETLQAYCSQLGIYQQALTTIFDKPMESFLWFLKDDTLISLEKAQKALQQFQHSTSL